LSGQVPFKLTSYTEPAGGAEVAGADVAGPVVVELFEQAAPMSAVTARREPQTRTNR
jgi:hypothetical protein